MHILFGTDAFMNSLDAPAGHGEPCWTTQREGALPSGGVELHSPCGVQLVALARPAARRGKGLLTGIRVKVPNTAVRDAARDRGLLVGVAGADVVRMAPPLIVSDEEIVRALDTLSEAVAATDLPPAKA